MKTTRRIYNFLAPDGTAAHDWIDRIQSCIQWSTEHQTCHRLWHCPCSFRVQLSILSSMDTAVHDWIDPINGCIQRSIMTTFVTNHDMVVNSLQDSHRRFGSCDKQLQPRPVFWKVNTCSSYLLSNQSGLCFKKWGHKMWGCEVVRVKLYPLWRWSHLAYNVHNEWAFGGDCSELAATKGDC